MAVAQVQVELKDIWTGVEVGKKFLGDGKWWEYHKVYPLVMSK